MTTAGTSLPTAKPGSLDEQLLSRDFLQDPYPTHRRLRREDPVHWCEPWRMWMVSRYEDVRTVLLKDGTTFSAVGQTSAALAHLSSVEHSQLESLQRIARTGRRRLFEPARASSPQPDGASSGRQSSRGAAIASTGLLACVAVSSSAPATPSIAAWWILK